MRLFALRLCLIAVTPFAVAPLACAGDDPFADEIIDYVPGSNAAPGYMNPATVLGSPERFTGEGFCDVCPTVVSPFSAPYGFDEIVSVGAGGQLVVRFDTPVTDDPNNPYGIDLLIFGNVALLDVAYPLGLVGGVFSDDGGMVEISADGIDWHVARGIVAEALMPTLGFTDSGPYDGVPGSMPTDFTRPADPDLHIEVLLGLTHSQVVELYYGSGGGVGVDLTATGLDAISYVRVSVPTAAIENVEIDALSDVSPRLPGDANFDGVTDVDDLLLVINNWGVSQPGDPPADLDNDHDVDVDDLLQVIVNWSA